MSDKSLQYIDHGLSQKNRLLPALAPENIKIDARNIFELSLLLYRLSSEFNYYNVNDNIDGDWRPFVGNNLYVIQGILLGFGEKKYAERYKNSRNRIYTHEGLHVFPSEIKASCNILSDMGSYLLEISDKLSPFHLMPDSVHPNIIEQFKVLHQCVADFQNALGSELNINLPDLPDVTPFSPIPDTTARRNSRQIIREASDKLDIVFHQLETSYRLIINHFDSDDQLDKPDIQPHIGMIVVFLNLFTRLQGQLNQMTGRHLSYYYNDILKFSPAPSTPDKVNMLIELTGNVDELRIPSGTLLFAKKDSLPDSLFYKITNDVVINHAKIAEIKTVYVKNRKDKKKHVLETDIWKADNNIIEPAVLCKLNGQGNPWPLFGEPQTDLIGTDRTMQTADIGFILSSPLLFLKEGKRTVRLRIYLSDTEHKNRETQKDIPDIGSHPFFISVSTGNEWLEVPDYSLTLQQEDHCIDIVFSFDETIVPLAQYDETVHGGDYDLSYPAVRLLLNNNGPVSIYSFLKNKIIERIIINVNVQGYRDVFLRNPLGVVSAENPFQIFGAQPFVGSYLDITDSSVFNKYTKKLTLNLEWQDLPREEGGFYTYYKDYEKDISNESFKIKAYPLSKTSEGSEIGLPKPVSLFKTADAAGRLDNNTQISVQDIKRNYFTNAMTKGTEPEGNSGTLRVELVAPEIGFGHRIFPQIFSEVAISNANKFKRSRQLPNPPYLPVLNKLAIDYEVEQNKLFITSDTKSELQLVHIQPFGFEKIYPEGNSRFCAIPQFGHSGNSYIGFKNTLPGTTISILVRFADKNTYHTNYKADKIQWSFLSDNAWLPLDNLHILSDTTNDLINTGIITLRLPDNINKNNTILNPALHWISASVNHHPNKHFKVTAIYTQAALATRDVTGNQLIDSNNIQLPASSIKGFAVKQPEVENIWQPFPSYGGRLPQSTQNYNTSVSERLRHKQRPITIMDIVQVVLAKFPNVLIAKCINKDVEETMLPGTNLTLVVVPRSNSDDYFQTDQPQIDIPGLIKIKMHLKSIVSPFLKINIINAIYERVKVVCSVSFVNKIGLSDMGHFTQQLNEDLRNYICPWLKDPAGDIKIGRTLYLYNIFNFIRNIPYVSYVTGFSVVHFYKEFSQISGEFEHRIMDSSVHGYDYIRASAAHAVLISSESHTINVLPAEDHKQFKKMEHSGIKNLRIGDELVVGSSKEIYGDEKKQSDFNEENSYDFVINI